MGAQRRRASAPSREALREAIAAAEEQLRVMEAEAQQALSQQRDELARARHENAKLHDQLEQLRMLECLPSSADDTKGNGSGSGSGSKTHTAGAAATSADSASSAPTTAVLPTTQARYSAYYAQCRDRIERQRSACAASEAALAQTQRDVQLLRQRIQQYKTRAGSSSVALCSALAAARQRGEYSREQLRVLELHITSNTQKLSGSLGDAKAARARIDALLTAQTRFAHNYAQRARELAAQQREVAFLLDVCVLVCEERERVLREWCTLQQRVAATAQHYSHTVHELSITQREQMQAAQQQHAALQRLRDEAQALASTLTTVPHLHEKGNDKAAARPRGHTPAALTRGGSSVSVATTASRPRSDSARLRRGGSTRSAATATSNAAAAVVSADAQLAHLLTVTGARDAEALVRWCRRLYCDAHSESDNENDDERSDEEDDNNNNEHSQDDDDDDDDDTAAHDDSRLTLTTMSASNTTTATTTRPRRGRVAHRKAAKTATTRTTFLHDDNDKGGEDSDADEVAQGVCGDGADARLRGFHEMGALDERIAELRHERRVLRHALAAAGATTAAAAAATAAATTTRKQDDVAVAAEALTRVREAVVVQRTLHAQHDDVFAALLSCVRDMRAALAHTHAVAAAVQTAARAKSDAFVSRLDDAALTPYRCTDLNDDGDDAVMTRAGLPAALSCIAERVTACLQYMAMSAATTTTTTTTTPRMVSPLPVPPLLLPRSPSRLQPSHRDDADVHKAGEHACATTMTTTAAHAAQRQRDGGSHRTHHHSRHRLRHATSSAVAAVRARGALPQSTHVQFAPYAAARTTTTTTMAGGAGSGSNLTSLAALSRRASQLHGKAADVDTRRRSSSSVYSASTHATTRASRRQTLNNNNTTATTSGGAAAAAVALAATIANADRPLSTSTMRALVRERMRMQ